MKNVKKIIAGILLTVTVLGTGTQLSVDATKYNLEGSLSEVNFNKRPTNVQNEFDANYEMDNKLAALFGKSQAQSKKEREQAKMQNEFDIDSKAINELAALFDEYQAQKKKEKEQAKVQNEFSTDPEVVNKLTALLAQDHEIEGKK